MPTKEQDSWTLNVLGIDVGAAAGAVMHVVHALPGSAMLPDCKPVKGKVQGPPEHLLCETHGHVVDVKEKKIIAISLDQYKSEKMGSAKPAHAAAPAQAAAPPAPAVATPPSPQAPPDSPASPAGADAAKAGADIKKVMTRMQAEVDDIAFLRAEHEKFAGGGKLNRAVSWVSDQFGGADDPGDDLAEISFKISIEQVTGMAAAMQQDFATAEKHLATMQALNDKAHRLFEKYTGETMKGADRTVTGLTAVSKVGDAATLALNVVAPGAGKILSVAKTVTVTGSKLHFGEKVNWTEVTVDTVFDLFVGGEGGKMNEAAKKLVGPLAKKLAPRISEAIAKKWGLDAVAKKLGKEVTEKTIEKYIETEAEEKLKKYTKDLVMPVAEKAFEEAKETEITHQKLADMMLTSIADPSGHFAANLADKLVADFKP